MEAVKCLVSIKNKKLDQKWLEYTIINVYDSFASHEKFTLRIFTLQSINKLHTEVSEKVLNDKLYSTYMKPLASDPVPNIRFNFAKTCQLLYPRLSNSNKLSCAEQLMDMASTDEDFDVRFFCSKAI